MTHEAYKEAHPLAQRLCHWAHLVSMVVLAFTGFYIHNPFFDGNMMWMRQLHFIFMYVVLIALVARVYLAFFSRSSPLKGSRETAMDVKSFLPQKENRGQFLETIKYYLFLRKTHPRTGKYNPLQKTTYVGVMLLLVFQAFTGFALYSPFADTFGWVTTLFGGLMVVRQVHYFTMWAFILFTMVHVYLTLAEDPPALPLMFWGKESTAGE
ncbi:MAG: Ni/Fe-hydrogenase, b-type cytochrome subunit [Coriobacteriia bacterium]